MNRRPPRPREKASRAWTFFSTSTIHRKAFLYDLSALWRDEFVRDDLCGLCANSGIVNTTGTLRTPKGSRHSGIRTFCICPNGRAMKDQGHDLSRAKDGRRAP